MDESLVQRKMDAFHISIISGDEPKTFLLDVIKVKTSERFCGKINESSFIDHKLFAISNIKRMFNHCLKCKTYKIDTLPTGSITVSFSVSIKLDDLAFDDTLTVECQAFPQTLQDKIIAKLQCQIQKLQLKIDDLEQRFNPATEDYDGDNIFYTHMMGEINPSASPTLFGQYGPYGPYVSFDDDLDRRSDGDLDRRSDGDLDRNFEKLVERNASRVNIIPFASIIEKIQNHPDAKNSHGHLQNKAASSSSAAPAAAAPVAAAPVAAAPVVATKKDDEKKPKPNQH